MARPGGLEVGCQMSSDSPTKRRHCRGRLCACGPCDAVGGDNRADARDPASSDAVAPAAAATVHWRVVAHVGSHCERGSYCETLLIRKLSPHRSYASENDFAILFLRVQKDYVIVAADMLSVSRSTWVQEYLTK